MPNVRLPSIRVRQVAVRPAEGPGFLSLQRVRYVAQFPDGSESASFDYDAVDRRALDAVVIAAFFVNGGEPHVYLRSAVRPPLAGRARHPAAVDAHDGVGLWELPAGLIEPSDVRREASEVGEGVRNAAARETHEELGFVRPVEAFTVLGHGVYPAPAMIAEKQFFVAVEVEPALRGTPSLDGSPLEEHAKVVTIALKQALQWCRQGQILDAKSELGLRRLAEALAQAPDAP